MLALALGVGGCSPSGFLAREMVKAPNRVPSFVKPEGRVLLQWPEGVIERFPTGTNEVGSPSAPIRWIRVEPAAFGMEVSAAKRDEGRRGAMSYRFAFRLPREGLPPSREAKGTAFLIHGYGVDLETLFPWAIYLAEAGWRSVLVDLRGHGLSGGKRVTFGILETNDLCRLRLALEASGQVQGPYVAVGHSLGAVLALRWQTVDPEIRASVALGPFARFVPAAGRLRNEYARWLPAAWVRRAAGRVPRVLGVGAESLETDAALRGHAPRAFLVASAQDAITPPEDASALRGWLGPGSGFLIVGGGTHETLPYLFEQHGPPIVEWLAGVAREAAEGTE